MTESELIAGAIDHVAEARRAAQRSDAETAQNLTPKPADAVALAGSSLAGIPEAVREGKRKLKRLPAQQQGGDQFERELGDFARKLPAKFPQEAAKLGFRKRTLRVFAENLPKGKPGRRRQEPIDKLLRLYKQAGGKFRERMFERCYPGFRTWELAKQKETRRKSQAAVRQRITQEKRRASGEL